MRLFFFKAHLLDYSLSAKKEIPINIPYWILSVGVLGGGGTGRMLVYAAQFVAAWVRSVHYDDRQNTCDTVTSHLSQLLK